MWWISFAMAAPVEVRVRVDAAHAVQALVRSHDALSVAGCNDAGQAPDQAADGIWSCDPVTMDSDTVDVLVLLDGTLRSAGALSWPEGAQQKIAGIKIQNGRIEASVNPQFSTGEAGKAANSTLLVRLLQYGNGPAPILVLSQNGTTQELNCHDDGSFPDATRNDGNPSCVGFLSGDRATITLKGKENLSFGEAVWTAGPLAYLSLQVDQKTLSTEAFEISLPTMSTTTRSSAPVPMMTSRTSWKAVAPWGFGLLLMTIGLGIFEGRRRQRQKNLAVLKPHAAPPLFEGGPSWAEPAVTLRLENPATFLEALLPELGRRVVLVAPPAFPLAPVAGVWQVDQRDWLQVRATVGELARSEGQPVLVVVIGANTLLDPGAVVKSPLAALVEALPIGVCCWVLLRPDEAMAAWLPVWSVSGPPWVGRRG